jgi:hypothetical protein
MRCFNVRARRSAAVSMSWPGTGRRFTCPEDDRDPKMDLKDSKTIMRGNNIYKDDKSKC